MREAKRLEELVGRRLAELRRPYRQEDVAAEARRLGLEWTPSTLAAIETGRRRLSPEELFVLPAILEGLGIEVTLHDLLPETGWVKLGDRGAISAELFRAVLREGTASLPGHFSAVRSTGRPDRRQTLALDASREATRKAARHFAAQGMDDVDALAVAQASFRLWGHGLTAERERRAAEEATPGADPRSKGHITRRLLEELRPPLERAARKKGGSR